MSSPKALSPGSNEPSDPVEVDRLLTYVPELSFFSAFDECVPSVDGPATHEGVDAYFTSKARAPIIAALGLVAKKADTESNGGLAFLVRTMLHFLQSQPVAASQHPLLVALYLRGTARASGSPETARSIALQMDRWS